MIPTDAMATPEMRRVAMTVSMSVDYGFALEWNNFVGKQTVLVFLFGCFV
jgi:hypothetical protein